MPNIQGKITYLYDNRNGKDGTPSKFPNFKFKIADQEIVLWANQKPDFLAKDALVSVTFGHSKKNGSAYVVTDLVTKKPLIQALVSAPQPDTSFNPDELEAELQSVAKTFDANLTVETKKPFNKDEYMFVLACIKSSLESNQLGANKESIDTFIKDMKFIYNHNF
jgi:hypothetical protein